MLRVDPVPLSPPLKHMTAVLLGAAVCLMLALPAFAQDAGGETLIGTFELAPAASGAALPAPREASPDIIQAGLYHDALLSLEAGRDEAGQRLLEQAIAISPDSDIAALSRRRLGDLYRQNAGQEPHPAAAEVTAGISRPKAAPPAVRTVARAPLPSAPMRLGAATAKSTVVAVPEGIAMDFLTEAGDRVFFSNGSAELGGRARAALAAQARWLEAHPGIDARIEGHADDPPMRPDEQEALSEARAEAVRQRLVEEGIAGERLGIVPWGREQRIADCDEAQCNAQNRRAITVLVRPGGAEKSDRRQGGERAPALSARGGTNAPH